SGPLAPRGLFYRIRSTPVLKTDASTFFQSTYTEHFLAWGLFPPVIYARQGQTSLVLPVYGLGDVYDLASALPATDLMVLQSAPALVVRSGSITYALTVSNGGGSAAGNVVVTDTLPANTTLTNLVVPAGVSRNTASVPVTSMRLML